MSVTLNADAILLSGPCPAADAETLLHMLQTGPDKIVDLTGAGHLHAAVVQVLLAFRPMLAGPAGDVFVNTWLLPSLQDAPPTARP